MRRLPLWLLPGLLLLLFSTVTWAQSVRTDKPDYYPGDVVQITGSGFHPNETIHLSVDVTDGNTWDFGQPWDATTDADGNLSTTWDVMDAALGRSFILSAECQHEGPDPAH